MTLCKESLAAWGPVWPGMLSEGQRFMRVFVDVPDVPSGRARFHTVASYVHAVLKFQALRRELAHVAVEVAHCKKMIASRYQGATLLAEAQTLLKELGVEPDAL
jgi:hypothetical protein